MRETSRQSPCSSASSVDPCTRDDSTAVSRKRFSFARGSLLFLLLSAAGTLFIFRGAVWNQRLLAPLDVAPNLYAKFKWMDPQASGIPRNHYLKDMFDFGLPRQYAFYRGLREGEFPWWDPYSDGGHPMVAEAHNNLTDPFRLLLYGCLPFEAAYNWTRIIHSLLLGFGMFVLLRHLRFSLFATVFGALGYQFACGHAFFFFPPNVEGSFLYFPLLWVVWSEFLEAPSWPKVAGGALACGAVFAAGNQQSHAYLPLFAGCFCAAYGGRSWAVWKPALQVTIASGLLGALLAAPVLLPHIELFIRGHRDVAAGFRPAMMLSGVLSLSTVFPWALGTFRTLDLGKLVELNGLGFCIYIGTAGVVLAILGAQWQFRRSWAALPELRMALLLVASYLVLICSTPLVSLFYTRAADLAVIGLTVCCARGIDVLTAVPRERSIIRLVTRCGVAVLGLAAAVNLLAFALYPRLMPRIAKYVLERAPHNLVLLASPALRRFQVANLPNEVTVRNPETVLALLGVLALMAWVRSKQNRFLPGAVLVLNLCPLLLYDARFIPSAPMATWHRLLEGGPEQKRLRDLVAPEFKRLAEEAPNGFECVFPGLTALLYKVHTLTHYNSFALKTRSRDGAPEPANYRYNSPQPGMAQGLLDSRLADQNVRFVWDEDNPRKITIERETCNSVVLGIEPGPPGNLTRTDTFYPGWAAITPGLTRVSPKPQTFSVPAEVIRVEFRYRPVYLSATLMLSAATLGVLAIAVLGSLSIGRP